MHLACGDEDAKHLRPEQFPPTRDPKACQTCSFRKLCWEVLS
jgi:CRISPR/Cas system-associated exonuclease Cas4 (RecB family)